MNDWIFKLLQIRTVWVRHHQWVAGQRISGDSAQLTRDVAQLDSHQDTAFAPELSPDSAAAL